MASAYKVEVSEDDQRLVTSGGWAVWAALAGEPGSILSVEAEDREEPRLGLGTLEAGVLTSDRVRPQWEAAGPRNLVLDVDRRVSNVNANLGYEGLGVSFRGSLRFGTRVEGCGLAVLLSDDKLKYERNIYKICTDPGLTSAAWPRCWPSRPPQWGEWTPPASWRTSRCRGPGPQSWYQHQCCQSQPLKSLHQPRASARSPWPPGLGPRWRWSPSPQSSADHENDSASLQTLFTFWSHCLTVCCVHKYVRRISAIMRERYFVGCVSAARWNSTWIKQQDKCFLFMDKINFEGKLKTKYLPLLTCLLLFWCLYILSEFHHKGFKIQN